MGRAMYLADSDDIFLLAFMGGFTLPCFVKHIRKAVY